MTRHLTIALVHNFMGPHGGAERSTYITYKLLKAMGHKVEVFSTDYTPMFEAFPHADIFPTYTDYDKLGSPIEKLTNFMKPFYNTDAKQRFETFLDRTQPDLVHFGSLFWHLSPSVIEPCVQRGIPTVMTLRESRFVCPAGTLMCGGQDYCADIKCSTLGSQHALKHRCYDDSLLKSAVVAAEFEYRKQHKLFQAIDYYICPSQALADLVIRAGTDKSRVEVVNNFVDDDWLKEETPTEPGEYFLYSGRISREKGVETLVRALAESKNEMSLKIAGSGPEAVYIQGLVKELGIDKQVEFLGHQGVDELKKLYKNAIATVLPCNWFENFPRTLIESHAMGRPAIGSDIGGIPEIIHQQITGLLVEPDNINELKNALELMHNDTQFALDAGIEGQRRAKTYLNKEKYLTDTLAVYEKALRSKKVTAN